MTDPYTHYLTKGRTPTPAPPIATKAKAPPSLSSAKPKRRTSGVPLSAVTGKSVNISPSAYKSFHACPLQYWLGYVARLRGESTGPQAMGVGIHAVAEAYLKGRGTWADPSTYKPDQGVVIGHEHIERFRPGIEHLPQPGTVGVEAWSKAMAGPLPFVGQIDIFPLLVNGEPTPYHPLAKFWITDHKSTGSFYWAKRSHQLVRDLQMHCYAWAGFNDMPGGPPDEVGFTHINYLTKYTNPAKCRKCKGSGRVKGAACSCGPRAMRVDSPPVPWSMIERTWRDRVVPTAEKMVWWIEEPDMAAVPHTKDPKVCKAYKGCEYGLNGVCPHGRGVLGTSRPSLIGLPYDLPDSVSQAAGIAPTTGITAAERAAAITGASLPNGYTSITSKTKPQGELMTTQSQVQSPEITDPMQRKMCGLDPLPTFATGGVVEPLPNGAPTIVAVPVESPEITDPGVRAMLDLKPLPGADADQVRATQGVPSGYTVVAGEDFATTEARNSALAGANNTPVLPMAGAVNPPDAPPTPTPTRELIEEAARNIAKVDSIRAEAKLGPAPDAMVADIMDRLRLGAEYIEQVKDAARNGATDTAPANGVGPAAAVNPPKPVVKVKDDDLAAAESIRDAVAERGFVEFKTNTQADFPQAAGVFELCAAALRQTAPRKKRIGVILDLGEARGWFVSNIDLSVCEVPKAGGATPEPLVTNPTPAEPAPTETNTNGLVAPPGAKVVDSIDAEHSTVDLTDQILNAVDTAKGERTPLEVFDEETVRAAAFAKAVVPAAEEKSEAEWDSAHTHLALPGVMFVVYVDCLPVNLQVNMTLALLLRPLEDKVALDAEERHYLQSKGFQVGERAVACLLQEWVNTNFPDDGFGSVPFRTLAASSSHPCFNTVLPILEALPSCLIVRGVR